MNVKTKIQIPKKFAVDFRLFDSFPDMCFIISNKGEILNSNISAQIKLNVPLRKTSINFFELIEEGNIKSTKEFFNKCLEENKSKSLLTKFKTNDIILDVELIIAPYWEADEGVK